MYTVTRGARHVFRGGAHQVYSFLVRSGAIHRDCSGLIVLLPDGTPTTPAMWDFFA